MISERNTTLMKCIQCMVILLHIFKSTFGDANRPCYCVKEEVDKLHNPVHLESVKLDGENVYFIAEQNGYIHKYNPKAASKLTKYIDIHDKIVVHNRFFEERGLLGFALHPDFAKNSRIFLYTIREINEGYFAVISEIVDNKDGKENIILVIQQVSDKRNGGQLLFGRDGYLYIFVGDGGPPDDVQNDAQNGASLLGKVLRIDVNETTIVDNKLQYYVVPADNPKHAGWRPEIYAIGGRNMWRCSVDKGDRRGRIFCGDLGSKYYEELNIIEKGGNYGWNIKEGRTCLNSQNCTVRDEVLPIAVFDHKNPGMTAIVGGPLYRGSQFEQLYGQLIYGDFASGSVFTLEEKGDKWKAHNFSKCDASLCGCNVRDIRRTHLLSVAEGFNGELFLLMTDELNPYSPRGALLSLHKHVRDNDVTCGAIVCYSNAILLSLCFILIKIS